VPIAERPEGAKLFAKLKKGDVVIALKLDRLFRSALDALQVVEDLKKRGVALHLLDLGGDVTGNGLSKVFMTLVASFAALEREKISERTRDAKRYLVSQGVFIGGDKPFGFDIIEDGDIKRLVPNAAEQAVLDRMKAMRADGASLREIGVVTGHWPKSVQRILERAAR
jgi:putative DNA-invertase from lambdoid prophage Rac